MLRENARMVLNWLRRTVNQPLDELDRWQRAARFAYQLGRHGARQLREDRAPQMAAALAFRTLFGLAPVLVVATVLVKSFRGSNAILDSLHGLLVAIGLDKIHVTSMSGGPPAVSDGTVTLAAWLEELTSQLLNMNLAAVGWIGFAVIVYAAIGLMVTIENSFNIIYRAANGRRWIRRIPLYWFLLTVSPAVIGLASRANAEFTNWIGSIHTWQAVLLAAQTVWSLGVAWAVIFAVYSLLPNSRIALRPALVGSLVATLLLAIGKHTLGAYLGGAFAINQLYGVLGLLPLFMFWVYLMWLAILFGLQVSATLQSLRGRSLEELDPPQSQIGLVEPACVLTVMEVIGQNFTAGKPLTVGQIAEITSLSEAITTLIVERLLREGCLHRIEHPEGAVSLARPPEQMDAKTLISLGFKLVDEASGRPRSNILDQLRCAQHSAVDGVTLAALLAGSQPRIAPREA
jgi:membrane protein